MIRAFRTCRQAPAAEHRPARGIVAACRALVVACLLAPALACRPHATELPRDAPWPAPELGPERAPLHTRTSVAPDGWQWPLEVPPVRAPRFIVVSDAPLATRAGADRLARGGNAADAAITVAFVLAVVYPKRVISAAVASPWSVTPEAGAQRSTSARRLPSERTGSCTRTPAARRSDPCRPPLARVTSLPACRVAWRGCGLYTNAWAPRPGRSCSPRR